jgi:L-asparaginase
MRVLLLATGGTIAYSPGDRPPGHGAFATAAELLAALPPGAVRAKVTAEDMTAEPSWDIEPATMLRLARRVRAAIHEDGYDGVVVTHGTDTLEESAYLIDLLAGPAAGRAGIVFTGSMRPATDPFPDGPRNLASAIAAATDPAVRGAGAVVCLDGSVHAARWATKVDSTSAAAFSSAPFGPIGRVTPAGVEPLRPPPPRPPAPSGDPESAVALIKVYPGIDPALLSTAVDAGVRGIVLEGTGEANVPVVLFTTIYELAEWNIPVVIASRCHTRPVPLEDLGGGAALAARMGAIGARGLAPAKARCALMVALGGGGVAAVRDWFGRI